MTPHFPIPIESLARTSITLANEVLAGMARAPELVQQDVLTLADAAELLRVPESAVRQLVASGEVPGRLIGGEWRLLRSTILTWLSGVDRDELDATGPKDEGRAAVATESWNQATSKEAEEFIQQVYASRRASAEDSTGEAAGK